MQTIDNRGLSCPEPVIRTKKALDAMDTGVVVSVVDNLVAKENVLRLIQSQGLTADVQEEQGIYHITITKGSPNAEVARAASSLCGATLLVKSNLLGEGDEQLGLVLMKSFFYALAESSDLPESIFFLNSGVKLTCQGSPVVDHLNHLQQRGVSVMSCGTCLDFYHLKEALVIGDITNMYTIVESLLQAGRTITL